MSAPASSSSASSSSATARAPASAASSSYIDSASAPAARPSSSLLSPLSDAEIEQSQLEWAAPSAHWDEREFKRRLAHNLNTCSQHAQWMEDTVLLDFLGLLHEQHKDSNKALHCYDKAIRLNPHNRVARANLARLQGAIELPVRSCSPVSDRATSAGLAWWSRAFYNMHVHQPELAAQCFQQALPLLRDRQPRLQFCAAKQYLRAKHIASRRADAQRVLSALRADSFSAYPPGFQLQILAESIRADATDDKQKQRAQVQSKVQQAERIASEHPQVSDALRPVYDFAGDVFYRFWKSAERPELKANAATEAQRLYRLSNAHQGPSTSSHANHHLALLERDRVKKYALFHAAIQQEPSNYAARTDYLKAMAADTQCQSSSVLTSAADLLGSDAFHIGITNRICVWVMKGQTHLSPPQPAQARTAFESAISLLPITLSWQSHPTLHKFLNSLRTIALSELSELYGALVLPEQQVRWIDAHLQLRLLKEAEELLASDEVARFPSLPDFAFQRARLTMLTARSERNCTAAVDALLAVAHLPLQHAQPGDMFTPDAPTAPVDDPLTVSDPAQPLPAIRRAVFRSALVNNVLESLAGIELAARHAGPAAAASVASSSSLVPSSSTSSASSDRGLIRCLQQSLRTLWLLQGQVIPQPDKSRLAKRTKELSSTVQKLFHQLLHSHMASASFTSAFTRPSTCLKLAARILASDSSALPALNAVLRESSHSPQSLLVHLTGAAVAASPAMSPPPAAPAGSAAGASSSSTAPYVPFQSVVTGLEDLRAVELELRAVALNPAAAASSSSSSSSTSAIAAHPASAWCHKTVCGMVERLLSDARSLLDYYLYAFRCLAYPTVHAKAEAAKSRRPIVPVNFPCVPDPYPNQKERDPRQLLINYLEEPLRFGKGFSMDCPRYFDQLLQLQPLVDARNEWMRRFFYIRNEETHVRFLAEMGISTKEVFAIGFNAAERVPEMIQLLTIAALADAKRPYAAPPIYPWPKYDCDEIEQYLEKHCASRPA